MALPTPSRLGAELRNLVERLSGGELEQLSTEEAGKIGLGMVVFALQLFRQGSYSKSQVLYLLNDRVSLYSCPCESCTPARGNRARRKA